MARDRVIVYSLLALTSCASVSSEVTSAPTRDSDPTSAAETYDVQLDETAPGAPSNPSPVGFEPELGWYIVGLGQFANVSGSDFEGDTFVSGGGSSEVVPELDNTIGFGGGIGWRFASSALEFSLVRLDPDGEWLGTAFDTSVESCSLELRDYLGENRRLQPHWLIGIGYGRLTVEDGSSGLGQFADAEFCGGSFNLGTGATYHLSRHLSLALDVGYRWQRYVEVEGVVSGDLEDSLTAHTLYSTLRLQLTL